MFKSNRKVLLYIAILLLTNILAAIFFTRVDLTEEKRYSLSDASKNLVARLPEQVEIEVLLAGDELNPGFERLKSAVDETLAEFKHYGGSKVNWYFNNPMDIADATEQNAFIDSLVAMGVVPTNVFENKNGQKRETLVFPYALVRYGDKISVVQLLKDNVSQSAQVDLNQSYENLEYELATAIRKLSIAEKKKIGLLSQFTNLRPVNFAGLIDALQENYDLFIVDARTSESFNGLDAIILPKPDLPIDDSTKFKIDQFIMNGGRALFFVDGLKIDSIGLEGTFAQPFEHNLEDLFFKYGVRVNQNLIKDGASALPVPLVVGQMGDKPNIQPIPYRFFPLLNNFGNHLITKNLDIVLSKFPSSIDTVGNMGISKIPLLKTTPYTKVLNAPALVTYNDARTPTDDSTYNQGEQAIAYLLEGQFNSLYENRILADDPRSKYFRPNGEPSKLIICSDGDLLVNDVDRESGAPLPLGLDKLSKHVFGNLDFVKNAVDYLVDENGVITARGKEVRLRPLDSIKIAKNRTQIQIVNLLVPVLIIILLAIGRAWYWQKKYGN